jgi:protein-S-isoprenylcysteine O-methyltransferase Ste14
MKLFKADNGMNIIGQGAKILLVAFPAALAAVWLHTYAPDSAALPLSRVILLPLGICFLILGVALWATSVAQLLIGFPQGKLVRTGAYGICRNPIYSSFALFIIPGISLMMGTLAYLLVSIALVFAVLIFIGKEEKKLVQVFGKEYEEYLTRVSRIVPIIRPGKRVG